MPEHRHVRALRLDVDEDDAGDGIRHRAIEQRQPVELDENYFVSEESFGNGLDCLKASILRRISCSTSLIGSGGSPASLRSSARSNCVKHSSGAGSGDALAESLGKGSLL